jgi:hypothetical protein
MQFADTRRILIGEDDVVRRTAERGGAVERERAAAGVPVEDADAFVQHQSAAIARHTAVAEEGRLVRLTTAAARDARKHRPRLRRERDVNGRPERDVPVRRRGRAPDRSLRDGGPRAVMGGAVIGRFGIGDRRAGSLQKSVDMRQPGIERPTRVKRRSRCRFRRHRATLPPCGCWRSSDCGCSCA